MQCEYHALQMAFLSLNNAKNIAKIDPQTYTVCFLALTGSYPSCYTHI